MQPSIDSDLSKLGRPARVLVADDDDQNRDLIEAVCRAEGFEALGVKAGAEAVAAAQREAFDLALIDASMPGMGGLEVCRILKADAVTAQLPIIIVTASADDAVRDRAAELGVVDTIAKPFRVFELVQRIRRALRPHSRGGDPPTAPRIRLRRGRIDLLSSLPSPRTLRARLARAIEGCAKAGRPIACAVVRLENEGKLSAQVGRSLTDALLGELVAALLERFPDRVVRADLDELCVLVADDELATLGSIIAQAPSGAAGLGVPASVDIGVRWGAYIAPADKADPDSLVAAARHAVDLAQRAGEPSHVDTLGRTPAAHGDGES